MGFNFVDLRNYGIFLRINFVNSRYFEMCFLLPVWTENIILLGLSAQALEPKLNSG